MRTSLQEALRDGGGLGPSVRMLDRDETGLPAPAARHRLPAGPGAEGFRRVALAAGASETVEFRVGPDERRHWHAGVRGFVLDASTFDVWVGGDSTASLGTTFTTVTG